MTEYQKQKYLSYIRSKLDFRTVLEQLSEEASELAQASLKRIRAAGLSKNVTPVTVEESVKALYEEMADVMVAGSLLGLCECPDSDKIKRWAERLGYTERKTVSE